MAEYFITGATGASAVLTGEVRQGNLPAVDDPLLQAAAVLEGSLRRPLSVIPGVIEVAAALEGGLFPSIPPLIDSGAELDSIFDLFWSSHDPLLSAPDLTGFVRRSDSATLKIVFGDVVGTVELPGSLTVNATVTGEVASSPLLVQSYAIPGDNASNVVLGTAVLEGSVDFPGARRSPPMVLLSNDNYLARPSSDSALNPSGAFTVSVTFDPELIEAGKDCVVVSKNNETDTQAGWKLEWNATTGLATFTVFGALDGSISKARPTANAIRVRSRVTAVVDGSGDITLHVNGASDQGTQTDSGVWVSPSASTEPLALGCDEPTNNGTNLFRGAIYDFAYWSTNLSASDANALLPDGSPIEVGLANLEVNFDATSLVANPFNGTFASWIDSAASFALSAGRVSAPIFTLAENSGTSVTAPPLPLTHRIGSLLFDEAAPAPDQNLTTLHRLDPTAKWRLWSASSLTPQISGYFRGYRGDITITVILARVSGANDIEIMSFRGVRLQYSSSSNVFLVLGDDAVGSTNELHDFPTVQMSNGRSEPSESVVPSTAIRVYTLRYNSFTGKVDLFDGTTRIDVVSVTTGQSANETRTGLRLADFGDFRSVAIIPACLSDEQVVQMVGAFNPPGWNAPIPPRLSLDNPHTYATSAGYITPFLDAQTDEPTDGPPSTATTASGTLIYAHRNGVKTSSVTITLPRAGGGTMSYSDNGSGEFTADAGAQPVSASNIAYANEPATGQVALSGQPSDGDTVTLIDGHGYQRTFEFESGGGVTAGNYAVTIGATADDTAQNLRDAINRDGFLAITASGSGTTVSLAQEGTGAAGNTTITVSGANLSKTDFANGVDAGVWSITITGGGDEFDTTLKGTADYVWLSAGLNSVGEDIQFDWIELPLTRLYLAGAEETQHLYVDAPYIIKDGFEDEAQSGGGTVFTDPQPTVVSVTADTTSRVTAVANAGPTNAGDVITWWEVEMASGNEEVVVVADYFQPNNFSINRNQTDNFTIPLGLDLNEKRIRFVVQAVNDASQVWKSLFFRMLGDEFDNAPDTIVTITQPGGGTTVGQDELLTAEEQAALVLQARAAPPTFIEEQDENSRYKLASVFKNRSRRGYELGFLPVLDDFYAVGSDFQTYVVGKSDIGFLDRVAVRYYGAGFEWAWWVIAYANALVDPDQEMFVGQRLVIPPRSALQSFLARPAVATLST